MPDCPEDSRLALTEHNHVRAEHIASRKSTMLARNLDFAALAQKRIHQGRAGLMFFRTIVITDESREATK